MINNLKSILLAGIIALGLGATDAYATGNGNDGCQIGNIAGHKDHGHSNEHKIDYMTKQEWLDYIAVNGLIATQISNNDDSNGWITWHIYDTNGKQIEVVHIKYKKEMPPIIEVPEQPEQSEIPEVPEIPETPEIENPEIPEVETPEQPEQKPEEQPEVPEEKPELPEIEDGHKEEIPMTPIEPSIPEAQDTTDIPMVPILPSIPNISEEDNIENIPPAYDEEDNIIIEKQPSEDDNIVTENKEEGEEIKTPVVNNSTIEGDIVSYGSLNPKTGDVSSLRLYLGLALSSTGLIMFNRKKK